MTEEVAETLAARIPLYEAAADIAVDTEDKSPKAVCDEILFQLKALL